MKTNHTFGRGSNFLASVSAWLQHLSTSGKVKELNIHLNLANKVYCLLEIKMCILLNRIPKFDLDKEVELLCSVR